MKTILNIITLTKERIYYKDWNKANNKPCTTAKANTFFNKK